MAERRVTENAPSAAAPRPKRQGTRAATAAGNATPRSKVRHETGVETARIRRFFLLREIGILVAIAVAALVALALLSFHPGDTGATWAETPRITRNWVGPGGATLAGVLVDAFGLCAFALPPLLGLSSLLVYLSRHRWMRPGEAAGLLGTALALCAVMDLAWPEVPFRGGTMQGGGVFGSWIGAGLRDVLSTAGAWIVSLTALAISARLAFGVQILALLGVASRGLGAAGLNLGHGALKAGRGIGGRLQVGAAALLTRSSREEAEDLVDDCDADETGSEEDPERADIPPRPAPPLTAAEPGPSVAMPTPRIRRAGTEAASRKDPPREPSAVIARVEIVEDAAVALIPERPSIEARGLPSAPPRPCSPAAPVGGPTLADAGRHPSLEGAATRGVVHAQFRVRSDRAQPNQVAVAETPPGSPGAGETAPGGARADVHRTPGFVSIPEPQAEDEPSAALRIPPGLRAAPPPPATRENEPRPQLMPRIQAPVARPDPAPSLDPPSRRFVPVVQRPFVLPGIPLLHEPPAGTREVDEAELMRLSQRLEECLKHYQVEGRVTHILPGPVVTMFEFEPAPGIKVARIANLENDLALALRAIRVRIVAPIPGKGAVGIEIPSASRETVYLREILGAQSFRTSGQRLPLALGKAIDGTAVVADMAKMPHLLVAGTTGSGKSVCVNTIILSLLYARRPDEVRMILVDPKMLEFSIYDGIPHLLVPVVTSPKKASMALHWAVDEMERRYKVLSSLNVRNIVNYNERTEKIQAEWEAWDASNRAGRPIDKPDVGRAPGEDVVVYRSEGGDPVGPPDKMPYIVIVIDELADLMMVARKEVEESIVRLAQKARASGIHLLLATQRPSVDVITGLIKANFPTRLSFQVRSKVDSRTVLDANGAENLLGMGDGLYLPAGASDPVRVHGAFVNDDEVKRVVDHLKAQGEPEYVDQVLAATEAEESEDGEAEEDAEADSMYDQAVAVVVEAGKASTSLLQRHLKLGYNRAARIIDTMEKRGIVGPADGARPREVYFRPYES